ncbi:hypothetical protein OGAPHI_005023 [Ogataea philodendri]|uniref:Glucosidase 2 subunit beta n=1 Tax=Ogataea philodendri TaxID=1378263 RepID=A0A9P8P1U9_9ASCO|nr:uncharacterized protein OGAPHI_005023 [Ogataea philodendri]KAH3663622.1 hypothetical protein OGAPHI_005023 [Ogataea philodendri]
MIALILLCVQASAHWVRGVSPESQAVYQPDENGLWRCLGDPQIVISADKINDDYCDCPDGSDEPGTSACVGTQFYCANEGFSPGYIPWFKVNDGVCDYDVCCDGSDEPEGLCPSKCAEMHAAWEKENQKRDEIVRKGLEKKEKLAHQVFKKRSRLQHDLHQLESKIAELEHELHQLSKIRTYSQEENEIVAVFNDLTAKVEKLSEEASAKISQLQAQQDSLQKLENVLDTMNKEYNHNFNDPAVKAAAQAFQEHSVNEGLQRDKEQTPIDLGDAFAGLKHELEAAEIKLHKLVSKPASSNYRSTFKAMVNSFLGVARKPAEITSLIDAERRKNEIEDELKPLRKDQAAKQKQLDADYGPDNIFLAMNSCVRNKIGTYDYRLCFTDKLEQINSNGQATRIGRYERVEYDKNNHQIKLIYEHGDKCWNGPVRRAEVQVVCGVDDEIIAVTEPEKCEYSVKIQSPIGCFKD